MSFLELLMALLLSLIVVGSAVATFIQITNVSRTSEIALAAVGHGRSALESLSREIKQASRSPAAIFVGENFGLEYGDGLDNDDDGNIDEESPNGADEDGDWVDRHVSFGDVRERPHGVGVADLGDEGVDEDCRFDLDRLQFHIDPPGGAAYSCTYLVTDFEGESHVLVRETAPVDESEPPVRAPLAYGVLSFNCLYWNEDSTPQAWKQEWNSAGTALPATVFVEIVIYADDAPIETYEPGRKVQTVKLMTAVNIE